ncbi:MAG TPA: hypothetical protein PKN48_00080 [Bacteroidales bacterium]|nr:hypothetical protein [Bacteroidales bacterium]
METTKKVWVPSGKRNAEVFSQIKAGAVIIYSTDYCLKTSSYLGLLQQRDKNYLEVNEMGVPKWAEEPCPTLYTLTCTPFMGMCPIGCKECIMQIVPNNKPFCEKKFAIFRESALRELKLPKKSHTIYVQSSFEAFHWQYPTWMHDLIFDMMVLGYWQKWFEHTRCPETFVKRILAGKPLPAHNLLGVSVETDHDVPGFCKASSIDSRLRNIEILTKAGVDLYVSIAPFIIPSNAEKFASRLADCGVTKVTLACNQLRNTDKETTSAALDFMYALGDHKIAVYVNTYSIGQWGLDAVDIKSNKGPKFISWGDDERKLFFDVK